MAAHSADLTVHNLQTLPQILLLDLFSFRLSFINVDMSEFAILVHNSKVVFVFA